MSAQIKQIKHKIYLIVSQCNGHGTSHEPRPPNNYLNDQYHARIKEHNNCFRRTKEVYNVAQLKTHLLLKRYLSFLSFFGQI